MSNAATRRADRPMRADAERNQRRILATAHQLLADRAFDFSLDDVAAAAGVGVGTVYRRFANKQELIDKVLEQYLREIAEAAETAADCPNPWQGLVQFMHYVGQRAADSRAFGQMTVEIREGTTLFEYFRNRVDPPLAHLLERGKQAGELRSDVAVTDLFAVITMLDPVASFTRPVDRNVWERYLMFALDGMRAVNRDRSAPTPTALTDEQVGFALRYRHRQ
ncbi:TetR/AcrR family transcriptional regulator [Nocardia vinacea]|uniref:TetR/AcrR family transcriptional regulator n=1 Tax=Nocardia vinacea TaxID=96468 RepID=UPI00342D9E15